MAPMRVTLLPAMLLAAACAAPGERWRSDLDAGRRHAEARRPADAEARLRSAVERSGRFPPDDPRRIESLHALASFKLGQGALEEAEALYLKAARLVEARVGTYRSETVDALKLAGDVQTLRERHHEAEATYRRALAAAEKAFGPEDLRVVPRLYDVSLTLQALGRGAEAEPLLKRSLEITEKKLGPAHPETAARLHDLAQLHQAAGRLEAAAPLYQRILAIQDKAFADPQAKVPFLQSAALFEEARGKLDAAEHHYKQVIAILDSAQASDLRLETALEHYAHLLRRRKRDREADSAERRARALKEARKSSPR